MGPKDKKKTAARNPEASTNYRSHRLGTNEVESNCHTCEATISDDENFIVCDFCCSAYHIACSDMSDTLFKALSTEVSTWNFWCCQNCRSPDLPRRLRSMQQLQERQDQLEKSISTLTESVKSVASSLDTKLEAAQKTLKMDILKEIDERRRRESNIIVIGLHERNGVNDLDLAKMLICDTLNCPVDIVSSRRIGKPSDGKPKLLHLTLRDFKQVQAVLSSASGLKGNNQYKNVFLSPDRSPMEQEEFRKLRNELKERRGNGESVVIRGSSIVEMKQPHRTFPKSPTHSTAVGNVSQIPDTHGTINHE